VNVSGGLKSYGHPVGATGVRMIYELATQLRGRAGERQVQGARIGLAHKPIEPTKGLVVPFVQELSYRIRAPPDCFDHHRALHGFWALTSHISVLNRAAVFDDPAVGNSRRSEDTQELALRVRPFLYLSLTALEAPWAQRSSCLLHL
jgi:Thiolase, C-terminal domain